MFIVKFILIVSVGLYVCYRFSDARKLNKQVFEYFKRNEYPLFEQFKMFIHYKQALLELNKIYTTEFDYLSNSHSKIFNCEFLLQKKIAEKFVSTYDRSILEYRNKNIHRKARKRIEECLYTMYVIESTIDYYEKHRELAERTRYSLENESFKKSKSYELLQIEVRNRVAYLKKLIFQFDVLVERLSNEKESIKSIILELEKCKNPTLWKIAQNMLTAPVRHPVNLVKSVIAGDKKGSFTNGLRVGLSLFGFGIISDAVDVLDSFVDMGFADVGVDFESADRIRHHVEGHSVEGYVRQDGTVVSGYERGGEDGYFRS